MPRLRPLSARAQAVFGEGPPDARVVFVGEQPGNAEDLAGHPFVGPAGRVFDKALAAAGIDRHTVYVTNAVKHFKFEERGKARLHKRPRPGEVRACAPWLRAELDVIRPQGASAQSCARSAQGLRAQPARNNRLGMAKSLVERGESRRTQVWSQALEESDHHCLFAQQPAACASTAREPP